MKILSFQDDVSPKIIEIQSFPSKFKDWIVCAHFLAPSSNLIAIGFVHNNVQIWDYATCTKIAEQRGIPKCFQRSMALHGDSIDSLIVASGTAFGQICVWDFETCGKKVMHVLPTQGHTYSLKWSADGRTLCSTGDERSVRVWDMSMACCVDGNHREGYSAPTCQGLYGHISRTWDCCMSDQYIFSCAEDCTARMWDRKTGACLKIFEGHTGKSVWRVALHPSGSLLATGGGDSSIRLWPIPSDQSKSLSPPHSAAHEQKQIPNLEMAQSPTIVEKIFELPRASAADGGGGESDRDAKGKKKVPEFPRCLEIADNNRLYAATNEGRLYELDLTTDAWRMLQDDPTCSNSAYACLQTNTGSGYVVLGDVWGKCTLVSVDGSFEPVTWQAGSSRVLRLSLDKSSNVLFVAFPDSTAKAWLIDIDGQSPRHLFTLVAPSPQRLHSFAWRADAGLLISGDNRGNLHAFFTPSVSESCGDTIHPFLFVPSLHKTEEIISTKITAIHCCREQKLTTFGLNRFSGKRESADEQGDASTLSHEVQQSLDEAESDQGPASGGDQIAGLSDTALVEDFGGLDLLGGENLVDTNAQQPIGSSDGNGGSFKMSKRQKKHMRHLNRMSTLTTDPKDFVEGGEGVAKSCESSGESQADSATPLSSILTSSKFDLKQFSSLVQRQNEKLAKSANSCEVQVMTSGLDGGIYTHKLSLTFLSAHDSAGQNEAAREGETMWNKEVDGVALACEFLPKVESHQKSGQLNGAEDIFMSPRENGQADLVFVGVKGTDFVVWNKTQNITLARVTFGGPKVLHAHSLTPSLIRFTHFSLRESKLHVWSMRTSVEEQIRGSKVTSEEQNSEVTPAAASVSPKMLGIDFHGKEVHDVVWLPKDDRSASYLITASEDCSIKVVKYTVSEELGAMQWECLGTYQGHSSAVRCLSLCPISGESNKWLLFSGGGHGALFVWQVSLNEKGVPVCSQLCRRRVSELFSGKQKKQKKQSEDGSTTHGFREEADFRVMSATSFQMSPNLFCVATGNSDGTVRMMHFDISTKLLFPLSLSNAHQGTVLCIDHIPLTPLSTALTSGGGATPAPPTDFLIFSGATDGQIHVFHSNSIYTIPEIDATQKFKNSFSKINPIGRFELHQSGVNDIFVTRRGNSENILLATAGDDQSVNLCVLEVNRKEGQEIECEIVERVACENAHASGVTGVATDGQFLYTTGGDYRFNVFSIQCAEMCAQSEAAASSEEEGPSFTLRSEEASVHEIPECCALVMREDGHSRRRNVAVCGWGLQILTHESS